jgi:hypothetical protein
MTKKTKLRIAKDALIDVYRSETLPRLQQEGFFIPNAMGASEGRDEGSDYFPVARAGNGFIELFTFSIWTGGNKKLMEGPRGPRGVQHARVNVSYHLWHLDPRFAAPTPSDFQPANFRDAQLTLDLMPPFLPEFRLGWLSRKIGHALVLQKPVETWNGLNPEWGLKRIASPSAFLNTYRVPFPSMHFWERETEDEARAQAVEEMGNYLSLIETWPKRRINVLSICGVNSYKVENRKTIKTGVLLPHEEEFQRVFVRPYQD